MDATVHDPRIFRAAALKSGLSMWSKHRIKPNRMWTPTAMMKAAAEITGETFRARDYDAAIEALADWLHTRRGGAKCEPSSTT